MSPSAVEISDLSVVYDKGLNETCAVDRLSLKIEAGEFFALLGPNGAGKTSVISTITNLLQVESGSVKIFGHPAGSVAAKRLLGVVPQELVQHGFFSLNQILQFHSGYFGIYNNQERIDFLLEKLKLTEQKNKKVSQLSGGMKRRVLIAKALVHSPKLLLLDEPSAGVDIELRTILWDFLKELNKSGMTILLTTHYLEEAQRLCERVAIMNRGKLLSLAGTTEMLDEMLEREIQIRVSEPSKISKSVLQNPPEGIVSVECYEDVLQIRIFGKQNLQEVLNKLGLELADIWDVQMKEGLLEDAFIRILGKDRHVG